jgi:DNA-binding PadR family transcriptional regulator
MRKLGTIDLEILQLAINEKDTFNENNLEKSKLKRFGVGKLLDSLASLKDRKLLSLNKDGSFSITDIAKEILWSESIPVWARILRLLQIKSCNIEQITEIIRISKNELYENLEKLRKHQFVIMLPQRQEEKIIKVYEIQSEGIEKINKTEKEGFENIEVNESGKNLEILTSIDEIVNEIKKLETSQFEKEGIIKKLLKLKDNLEI